MTTLHPDFLAAQELAYKPNKLMYKNLTLEPESQEYGACEYEINGHTIKFRVAKTTPIKIGQFVTFWKRIESGPIIPYDISDQFDYLVVSVRTAEHFGQFIFPKASLAERGFVSKGGKGGKRAMRVYPPWDVAESYQARNSQKWQLEYFFDMSPGTSIDNIKIQKLF